MAKNPTTGLDITNNADGAQISGGTTARILKWLGAAVTLTGSGTNVYTFPAATDTLAGLGTAQTFTATQTVADLKLGTAGNGLYVKEGTNATMGTATLASGTATVSTTKVTANSRIFLTIQGGTLTNVGFLYVSARTAGTSFVVTSSNASDAATIAWLIVEPA
jgi:hypothetical protein